MNPLWVDTEQGAARSRSRTSSTSRTARRTACREVLEGSQRIFRRRRVRVLRSQPAARCGAQGAAMGAAQGAALGAVLGAVLASALGDGQGVALGIAGGAARTPIHYSKCINKRARLTTLSAIDKRARLY